LLSCVVAATKVAVVDTFTQQFISRLKEALLPIPMLNNQEVDDDDNDVL